jgi:predicted ATPase
MNRAEPMVLCSLAEALAVTGAVLEGLQTLAAGLAAAETSGTHWADPELHRLRGELLGRLPSADWREVQSCFRMSRAVAREQGSRGFELRAAVSLARLLCTQGRQDDAHGFLAPVYGSFTEGFGTQELKNARTLLADLA